MSIDECEDYGNVHEEDEYKEGWLDNVVTDSEDYVIQSEAKK
jgi:hypothetical protein